MINVAIFENQMQESLVSLVTGSPNLWITKDRSPINGQDRVFVNQAEIIQSDIQARSSRLVSKLYIPSTLNIDLILWHTQLIVCAVKC